MPSLVTLGIDPGVRYVGWAVVDDRLVEAGVWDLTDRLPGHTAESILRALTFSVCYQHAVRLIALETFHWRGRVSTQAPTMFQLIGAVRSLGRSRQWSIVEVRPADWMRGIMGYLPEDRRLEHRFWKAQIRDQLGLLLEYDWPAHKRSDPTFGHASDAAGIAYHCRSQVLILARTREG
jgi:Holliday junction resolvasome RuvABC endonuclease subunit